MKTISKIVLVSTGLISMGALTACQTTQAPQEVKKAQYEKKQHKERLSPEQREQFKQARQERKAIHQQLRQACDGKNVGDAVQIKTASQTINGTCQVRFNADRKDLKNLRGQNKAKNKMHHDQAKHKQTHGYSTHEPLTDAQRAELVKKFDQRLAQRQAHQQAQLTACQGQTNNKQVQIKVGDQTINGVCKVYFKPLSAPSKS